MTDFPNCIPQDIYKPDQYQETDTVQTLHTKTIRLVERYEKEYPELTRELLKTFIAFFKYNQAIERLDNERI